MSSLLVNYKQEIVMRRTILSLALATGLSTSAMAADNSWDKQAKDAWIDGKAEATLLFNGNLDSFDINTDVKLGKVTLTGKVNNSVEKQLAEELISGIDGVTGVDNMLTVLNTETESDIEFMSSIKDAKIATVVKSRLLLNSEVSGTNINVDTEAGIVTLKGIVETDAERDLAVNIAKNTDDVKSVNNMLRLHPKKVAINSKSN